MGVGLSDEEDRKQFAGIVVPHLTEAFVVASWLTGNRTDAEDVVQEACLRAFRAIGSFAGVNARAWVLTIVPPYGLFVARQESPVGDRCR